MTGMLQSLPSLTDLLRPRQDGETCEMTRGAVYTARSAPTLQLLTVRALFFAALPCQLVLEQYPRHDDAELVQHVHGHGHKALRHRIRRRENCGDDENAQDDVAAVLGHDFD